MGRIQIPVIGVDLPIYHGTHSASLDRGVGHLEGTSFPIGGENTHSVLTAHTGLPNARMFTDMEGNVNIGDKFFIDVMGRRLAYEVDHIEVIYPHMVESMRIFPGQDLVTLMTCTPYTINSHRLLVRGRRIEYIPYMAEEIEQAIVETRVDVRIFVFVAFFLLFMMGFAIYNAIMNRRQAQRPARPGPAMPRPLPDYEVEVPAAAVTAYYENHVPYENHIPIDDRWPARSVSQGVNYTSIKPTTRNSRPSRPGTRRAKRRSTALPNMTRNIAACFIALLIITGAGFAAAQVLGQNGNGRNGQTAIEDFVSRIDAYNAGYRDRWVAEQLGRWLEGGEVEIQDAPQESPLHWLYQRITEHNRYLYESNRSLPDPFDGGQDSFNLSYFGFDDEEMIGFITMPGPDIKLPIFMGASRDNLRRGAAHVTGSSLPIGGPGTNAVLGVHLGHTNLQNRVDEIDIGSEIRVTNFYETITYTIINVQRSDSMPVDMMNIQSDQDTLTILGYRPGSQERYVIVAIRAE